jgi:hypothetical protein
MNDEADPTGRAKGGVARAQALTKERRAEIAVEAAKARWSKEPAPLEPGVKRAAYGSPDKMLKIGDAFVECYVLEDGIRVLSGRGMQAAIGFGGEAKTHGSKLRAFLDLDAIKPFVNNELAMALANPVRFVRPGRGGKPAIAFEGTLLIDLCEAIINAMNAGTLRANYLALYRQAQIITLSFAKAGIIAAIDEVTGYQQVREQNEIQKIVDKYLTDYAKKWAKVFPDEFWDKLLRAKGYESYIGLPRRSFVGHWVNDVVYARLAPVVLQKLQQLNPRANGKSRKFKHHQFLSEDHGAPELRQHLIKVMTLMDLAIATGQNFDQMLSAVVPRVGDTYQLPLVNEKG